MANGGRNIALRILELTSYVIAGTDSIHTLFAIRSCVVDFEEYHDANLGLLFATHSTDHISEAFTRLIRFCAREIKPATVTVVCLSHNVVDRALITVRGSLVQCPPLCHFYPTESVLPVDAVKQNGQSTNPAPLSPVINPPR